VVYWPVMSDSLPTSTAPTVNEVHEIAGLSDPILRNLRITQCYSELSLALETRTGYSANWCTFATWASKQAGQSIRKEDLQRTLERMLRETSATHPAGQEAALAAQLKGTRQSPAEMRAALFQALDLRTAVEQTSQAVGRGNKKVFEEIGYEFARFSSEFLQDAEPDLDKLDRFCSALRPGEPPDGQRYLRQAFTRYYQSFFVQDAKARAELLLCANLEIGLHEQTRLQPEIAEALDAPFIDASQFTRQLIAVAFPASSWLVIAQWLIRRWLGRPTIFDLAVQSWLSDIQKLMREALTEIMMTIHLPPDLTIRLGDDLSAAFPEDLRQLVDPDLRDLLARIDPTPDSTSGSGALDWADLPDRLHFIADLFRCFQESRPLFDSPFSTEQVVSLKAGHIPGGQL
jgi:hypothetical protein